MTDSRAVSHLAAVAEVTQRSQQIALVALHEALTAPVSPERVAQLRRVTDDLNREVGRLEDALGDMLDAALDAPVVRTEDPPVTMPLLVGLRDMIFGLATELGKDYPVTAEDAAGLGQELAVAGDVQGLRQLRELLLREAENPVRYGAALDRRLYGEPERPEKRHERTAEEQAKLDTLARIARMASGK
jgi:hypothetical protein